MGISGAGSFRIVLRMKDSSRIFDVFFFCVFFLPGESETGDRSYKNPSRLMWDVGCGVKIIFETNKVDSFK